MLSGLYNAAQGMVFAGKRHEVSSENIAHSHMPGYRRKVLNQTEFGKYLEANQRAAISDGTQAGAASAAGQPGSLSSNGAQQTTSPTAQFDLLDIASDFSTGPMQQTGRPLDIAIEGDGFFVVEGPGGPLYTRNGSFHADALGRIVTVDNLPLQGTTGALTLPADASSESITILNDGQIFADQTSVGQLRIVSVQNPQDLIQMGETLYAATASSGIEDADVKLSQGMLEASNVTAVAELVNLIVATRQYEAAQKTLTAIDTAIRNRIDL